MSYFAEPGIAVNSSIFIADTDLTLHVRLQPTVLPQIGIGAAPVPDEMLTFSASEITAYKRCPYMYLLRQVYGYQPQLQEAIGYGKSVHFCLRRAIELVKKDGQDPITAAATAVDKEFFMPYAGGVVLGNFKRGARSAVLNYATYHGKDLSESMEAEYRIEFQVHNATVMGRIDVLSNKEVRDYKTAEDVIDLPEGTMQVQLYAAGLRKVGRQVEKGSIAYLSSSNTKIQPIDVSELSVDRTIKEAERIVEGIVRDHYEPKQGPNCQKCDQNPICRWRSNPS
jgi:DNA helicase-2/ATP-dependent DNA helicase PcrA